MTIALRMILRIVVSLGAVVGLMIWVYCSMHGDWPNAAIAFGVYFFSLVMLS